MKLNLPFLKRRAAPARRVPEGWRLYAIGDVHGCLDHLNRLLDAIDRDLQSWDGQGHIIFLGDLVDRGPDSAGVIRRLIAGGLPGDRADFLMGNHEEVMLECFDGNLKQCGPWLQYGGIQTLESYGLSRSKILERSSSLPDAMREAIPEDHVEFLRSFDDHLLIGDYLFVHAGIRPGAPLEHQLTRDLRWIRGGFLNDQTDHGFCVVHGHTIVNDIDVRPNRIGVDTGCYLTGTLTALVLDNDQKGHIAIRDRSIIEAEE